VLLELAQSVEHPDEMRCRLRELGVARATAEGTLDRFDLGQHLGEQRKTRSGHLGPQDATVGGVALSFDEATQLQLGDDSSVGCRRWPVTLGATSSRS
jgi:hypothetical protein